MGTSEKEGKFQVCDSEKALSGRDMPALELNECTETSRDEYFTAHTEPHIAVGIVSDESKRLIRDQLASDKKHVTLRSPLLTFPNYMEDQKLRKAAKKVLDVRCGLCAGSKRRETRKYYEQQVNLLDCYENDRLDTNDDKVISIQDPDVEAISRQKDAVVAKIVFVANVCLLLVKTIASYLSGSLSVISTVLDSVMDLTCGVVIWMTMRAIKHSNPYRYPRGRTRLEPIAIIIVSIIMGIGNVLMILQSISSIVNNTMDARMALPTVALVLLVIWVKTVLYSVCARRHTSSSAVLAMDQRNDAVANIVALAGALVGTHLWPYADPMGAVGVCTYIAANWFRTASGQVSLLSGKSAGSEIINRIIKLGIDHDERIQCLDTALAYHFGNDFLVELHVVMKEETITHREAHDISESLQYKLERLPFVERAFVHSDWEVGDDYQLYQKKTRMQTDIV